jgi:PAS domain S-box-containing protein
MTEVLSESLLRGLFETAPDAIVAVDSSGQIVLANEQTERLFGYSRDELIGSPVDILVPDSVRARHPAHRDSYFTETRARPMGAGMDLAARRRDGTEFPAEISLSAVETPNGVLVSAAIRDVTERLEEQAERERLRARAERDRFRAQLEQSQRLESLGQLAGGVAHDFNNLIAVVTTHASFVQDAVETARNGGEADWRVATSDLEQVQKAADRAAVLTRQLLAFARREVARPEVLALNAVVTELEVLLRRTIGEHITLDVRCGADVPNILADRGQIEQVLMNLVINARDAMLQGGTLLIDTSYEERTGDPVYETGPPPGDYVRLRVSDTGTGMPPEVRGRALEPFFTTKSKGEGTGLGLATVYGIVTQSGGDVHLYSEFGVGTTVSVWLPTTDDRPQEAPAERRGPTHSHGETVLVVEDGDALRDAIRRILERAGYQVITADRGSDAVALAERLVRRANHPLDLLVTDVILPVMLGKEVAERVSEVAPDVRVLFVSGYAHPVLSSQGTLDDGVVLLEKPFTDAALLEKVREVLDAPRP